MTIFAFLQFLLLTLHYSGDDQLHHVKPKYNSCLDSRDFTIQHIEKNLQYNIGDKDFSNRINYEGIDSNIKINKSYQIKDLTNQRKNKSKLYFTN